MSPVFNRAVGYSSIVGFSGFLFGFDASVISGVIPFVTERFHLSLAEVGAVVSAPSFANLCAGPVVGPCADRFGRKPVLLVLALLYLGSAAFAAVAPNVLLLILARAVGGVAFGSLIIAPLYIAELAPARQRGRLVSIHQLNIMIGLSAAYFANNLILSLSRSHAALALALNFRGETWNWMLGIQCVPALLFLFLLLLIPESPRWLALNGRVEAAGRVLARLGVETSIGQLLAEIDARTRRARTAAKSRLGLLAHPRLRPVLMVAIVIAIAQQITGINAVYFYAPTIFEQSGVGRDAAFAQAVWVGVVNVGASLLAMALIDRIGRKPLLIAGLAGACLSLAVVAFGFQTARYELPPARAAALARSLGRPGLADLGGRPFASEAAFRQAVGRAIGPGGAGRTGTVIKAEVRTRSKLILLGILGFVGFFSLSLGPVMWVLLSEIFPNRIRGLAISTVTLFNNSVSFGVQLLFPLAVDHLGAGVIFAGFSALALVALLILARFMRETRSQSLEYLESQILET